MKQICIYFSILTVILIQDSIHGQSTQEQFEYTSIHVTGEDGSQQIFTVKAVEVADTSCTDCQSTNCKRNTNSYHDQSRPLGNFNNRVDPNQSSSVVFGQILNECEKGLPADICRAAQDLHGHCSQMENLDVSKSDLEEYSSMLVEKNLLPMASGHPEIDIKLAYGGLLAALNRIEEAKNYFDSLAEIYKEEAALYFMKGMTNMHQGLQKLNLQEAAVNFLRCTQLDPLKWECFEKAAEAFYGMGQYEQALESVEEALSVQPSARLYFTRANIHFYMGDLLGAEKSFELCADLGDFNRIDAIYNLGLVRFHRGKIRESIGAFREAIKFKKEHLQAHVSLAHAYKELGNYPQALRSINSALELDDQDIKALQVQGMLFYYSGQPETALASYKRCLSEDAHNQVCLYMLGLCHLSLGHFYEAIKAETKAIVYSTHPALRASSEYLKAHYLREYSRYLHRKLDVRLQDLSVDEDLCSQLKEGWLKNLSFDIQGVCTEQPGLQPDVADVHLETPTLPDRTQELLCFAKKIGTASEVNCDGYLPSRRQSLALGLASVHVAQHLEAALKTIKPKSHKNTTLPEWQDLYTIATQYFRLVDPELPVFWLDSMPEDVLHGGGFKTDLPFIEGHVINVRAKSYFDLVFRLVKSMLDNYQGGDGVGTEGFRQDLKIAESEDDLIHAVRRSHLRDQGFVISTQVPGVREGARHEGVMILLSGASGGKVDFVMNHITTRMRTDALSGELRFLLQQVYAHVRRKGSLARVELIGGGAGPVEAGLLSTVLSLAYYLYNLMPLTRGSSLVTGSVLAGIVLALGGRITGKLPPGKLLEMEALLSGAPDAFAMVTQPWLDVQKSNFSVSDFPRVEEVFPTVRSLLELLKVGVTEC